MPTGWLRFFFIFIFSVSAPLWSQSNGGDFSTNLNPTEKQKVPQGVIIVKGAWSSASDKITPVPEGSSIANNVLSDKYFGLNYPLPAGWYQKFTGPPPSDSGRYVLGQIIPSSGIKNSTRGSILVTAQDMFFTPLPASNAVQLINYTKDNLQADYKMELKPTETKIAGQPFTFFAYWSPVAGLHWYVLATQIRCHTLEFVLSSQDTKLLESLILDMNNMKLPAEAGPTAGKGGGDVPVCIKDYASEENLIDRADPVFTEHRFNPVPVRIIIDKQGKIKHIHFLSAFPDQSKAITEALRKWQFRPHLVNGQRVEVETGIMFGQAPRLPQAPTRSSSTD